jgi:hypothetical protein
MEVNLGGDGTNAGQDKMIDIPTAGPIQACAEKFARAGIVGSYVTASARQVQ